MSKYQYKRRLKEYIANHGKPDALTEYLLLQGYSEEEIKGGLEPYVAEWEDAIKWIERGDAEEYDWHLWQRSELYDVLRHASVKQIEPYLLRIEKADEHFISITRETEEPFDRLIDTTEIIIKEKHWWLFRIPINGTVWR